MGTNLNEHSFFNKNNWNSWVKLTYYSTNNWRNYKFDYTHSHDRLEILYVYYGELTLVYSDDKNWKEVTVHSNGYILIDASYASHRRRRFFGFCTGTQTHSRIRFQSEIFPSASDFLRSVYRRAFLSGAAGNPAFRFGTRRAAHPRIAKMPG